MENKLSIGKIIRLIKVGKEVGLSSLKLDELEVTFQVGLKEDVPIQTVTKISTSVDMTKNNELLKSMALAPMTEEEIKYYATPYYDELQALKDETVRKAAERIE